MSRLYESMPCEMALPRQFAICIFQFSICIYPQPPFTSSRHELFPFDLRVPRGRCRNYQPFAPHSRKGSAGQAQPFQPLLLLSSPVSPNDLLSVLAKPPPTSPPLRCKPPPP